MKIITLLSKILDLIGVILHYSGLVASIGVIYVSLYFLVSEWDTPFTIYTISILSIMVSVLSFNLIFILHHYIYRSRLYIDVKVVMNLLTTKKALKTLKTKDFEIPTFNFVAYEYANYGALFTFKTIQKKEKYKDINFNNIPSHLKNVFRVFFIGEVLFLLSLILGIILFYFAVSKQENPNLKKAKEMACHSFKLTPNQVLYYRTVYKDAYVFTLKRPQNRFQFDADNAIYVKTSLKGSSKRSSSHPNYIQKETQAIKINCKK